MSRSIALSVRAESNGLCYFYFLLFLFPSISFFYYFLFWNLGLGLYMMLWSLLSHISHSHMITCHNGRVQKVLEE